MHQRPSKFKGQHLLAELIGSSYAQLNDQDLIVKALRQAILRGGATLLDIQSFRFEPHGVTAFAILSESHASIHTYPEKGSAFLDVFTCGHCKPEVIAEEIATVLGGKLENQRVLERTNVPTSVTEEIAAGLYREWKLDEVIVQAQTAFQNMLIGRTAQGLSLFCNGERQSTDFSQRIYHEGQILPAALMAGTIDRALIIGSSEGVVSQMAEQLGAQEIVHVDIDEECVRLCARHLPYGYTLEDVEAALAGFGPIKLVFQDGYEYVRAASARGEKFDIVVMDLPDEQLGEAQQNRLYDTAFLVTIASLLTPEGAFINQAGSTTYWRNETLWRSVRRMRSVFKTVVFFEMEEQDWAWIVGANFLCDDITARMRARLPVLKLKPEFIDEVSIPKATTLPMSIRHRLKVG